MRKFALIVSAALLSGAVPCLNLFAEESPKTSPASARPADVIVAEFDAAKPKPVDQTKINDTAYRAEYQKEVLASRQKRAALALELWKTDSSHPRAFELIQVRWQTIGVAQADVVLPEIESLLSSGKNLPAEQVKGAKFARAMISATTGKPTAQAAVDDFIATDKADPRGADLLNQLARSTSDKEKAKSIYQRIVAEYPESRPGQAAAKKLKTLDGVGKPFELAFTEATTGQKISVADLKGKVVVVDFWATWCGPCIAEMPNMKKLYAEYKDKGVEFIGVSLDQPEAKGGLTKLKAYVAKNEITWPQYYQGNYWQSEFSMSWGIDSIPRIFIVDADGNLASTEARGQLEKLIPELLAKRDAAKK